MRPQQVTLLLTTVVVLLLPSTTGRYVDYEGYPHLSLEDTDVRAGDSVIYTGAVLEYEPYNTWTEGGGEAILMENAKILAEYAASAKAMGADILVGPEYGLQGIDMHVHDPEDMVTVTQHVPDPMDGIVPCTSSDDLGRATALRALSCSALENQMYLVVDMAEVSPCIDRGAEDACPPSGNTFFNTQVVFDRSGAVIARYRKKNLFLEGQFHPGTENDDSAIFTTDFGVTFTLQICFDIAYSHPGLYNVENKGIRDVVMSTAWNDVLPFWTAPSAQNAWSRRNGVNLLVSGYHFPERAKLGSGIYRGASDLAHDYVYDPDSGSKLIVSEIETVATAAGRRPSRRRKRSAVTEDDPSVSRDELLRRDQLFYFDDLSNYTQVVLRGGDSEVVQYAEACHEDGLCCHLSYSAVGDLTYSLLAYSGFVRLGFDEYQIYTQICAVVWCRDEALDTCGRLDVGGTPSDAFPPFEIHAQFSAGHVYPILLTRDLVILDNDLYDYSCNDQNTCTLSTASPVPEMMTASLYGRWFERDP